MPITILFILAQVHGAVPAPPPPAATAASSAYQSTTGIIDLNLMAPILGKASVEYEGVIGRAATVIAGPQLEFSQSTSPAVSGFGHLLGLHIFPGGAAPAGVWFGPEITAGYLHSATQRSAPGAYLHLDGLLGFSFFPAEHFALSMGIGGGFHLSAIQIASSVATAQNNGFGFTGRLSVGYGW